MLTSFRGYAAATLFASTALMAVPAAAAEAQTQVDSQPVPAIQQIEPIALSALKVDTSGIVAADAATSPASELAADFARVTQEPDAEVVSQMEGESGFDISGNVALVTDYRFRGVSFTDGDPALQGGIDIAHSSGFYIGTWASTISGGTPYGEIELDIYAGWSGDVSDGVSFDIGLLYYIYPTENELANALGVDTDYFEPYASISGDLGPVSATFGVAYAWEQNSLGNDDNIYLYTDFETAIPDTPITLTAHLGYTDGVFSTDTDSTSFDWGLGASFAVTDGLSLGVNYVDTEGPSIEDFTDAGIFFTLAYSM